MPSSTTGTLVGFMHPTGSLHFPSFLIPVFEVGGHLCLQDGAHDGKIEEFVKYDPIDSVWNSTKNSWKRAGDRFFIIWNLSPRMNNFVLFLTHHVDGITGKKTEDVKVGEDFQIAYADQIFDVQYGNLASIRNYLAKSADFYSYNPFFALEVADFIGNRKQYQRALEKATNILMSHDKETAFAWRKMMTQEDDNDHNDYQSAEQ